MLDTGGFEVPEKLRHMLVRHGACGFQFDDQAALDKEVSVVVAKDSAIFIVDFDRMLLFHIQAELTEPVGQRVLIHFLQMTMAVENVDGIGSFPDDIA